VEVVQLMLLDIGCRIIAVLSRVRFKVATVLIAMARDSGGSAADVLTTATGSAQSAFACARWLGNGAPDISTLHRIQVTSSAQQVSSNWPESDDDKSPQCNVEAD
jgi:hypothetical protein